MAEETELQSISRQFRQRAGLDDVVEPEPVAVEQEPVTVEPEPEPVAVEPEPEPEEAAAEAE